MKATNFDIRISKTAALALIKPLGDPYTLDGKHINCLLDELDGMELMCKEYGEDEDWVGMSWEDYETMQDEEYQTFELWLPAATKRTSDYVPLWNSALLKDVEAYMYDHSNYRFTINEEERDQFIVRIYRGHTPNLINDKPVGIYVYYDEDEWHEDVRMLGDRYGMGISIDPYEG